MEVPDFKEIKRLLNVCYQCGTCVSSCAAGLVNPEKNIRKFIQNLVNTEDEFSLKQNDLLWLCATCYQCEDRCPEGIPLASLLIQLKNMAAGSGSLPAAIRNEIEALRAHGFTYPPLKSMVSRRRRLGLPDLPRPDETEMHTLMTLTQPDDNLPNSGERKN
jgi:heterodisulfide reductase subunit C